MLTMSVGRNLTMATMDLFSKFGFLRIRAMGRTSARQIADLSIYPANPNIEARKLSGGNQQKILIGKWLLRKPRILILDEPTVGVDIGAKSEVYAILRALRASGTAILVVSSDMEEVMTIADRIMVMAAGRVQGIYDANNVTQREIVEHVGGV
jgi:ABC-type sugar transport system ATPase subunit